METLLNSREDVIYIYYGDRKGQCCKCKGEVPLVCCDNCSNTFHLECVQLQVTTGDLFCCGMCRINGQDTPETIQFKRDNIDKYLLIHKGALLALLAHPNYRRMNGFVNALNEAPGYRNVAVQKRKFTSTYRGVYCRSGKWNAQIQCSGTKIYLGSFPNEIQAAVAYDLAAVRLHKEKAVTNFIASHYGLVPLSLSVSIPPASGEYNSDPRYLEYVPMDSDEQCYDDTMQRDYRDIAFKRPRKRRNIRMDDVQLNDDDVNLSDELNSIVPNPSMGYDCTSNVDEYAKSTDVDMNIESNGELPNDFNSTQFDLPMPEFSDNYDGSFGPISDRTKAICITNDIHDFNNNVQTDGSNVIDNLINGNVTDAYNNDINLIHTNTSDNFNHGCYFSANVQRGGINLNIPNLIKHETNDATGKDNRYSVSTSKDVNNTNGETTSEFDNLKQGYDSESI